MNRRLLFNAFLWLFFGLCLSLIYGAGYLIGKRAADV